MSDKLTIMSISVQPQMQDHLKSSAKKIGCSVSELIRTLVSKYLWLIVNDGTDIPIVLKVPAHLRENEEELRKWLAVRNEHIVKAMVATA